MSPFGQLFWMLFATAFLQNIVLSTGMGSSILLRLSRKPRNVLPFTGIMLTFSLLSTMIGYPVDNLLGTSVLAKWFRPFVLLLITVILYLVLTAVLNKYFPALFERMRKLLPLAAFNNLVLGVVIIANHQIALTFAGTIGLSVGACLGFLIMCWITAEGIERLDNPDVPKAFRGLPSLLIYLGLLALALMGFTTGFSLI